MNRPHKHLLAAAIAVSVAGAAPAQVGSPYRIDTRGEVVEDRVLYTIGGGPAVGAPASFYTPGRLGVGVTWRANMMCGNFDLQATVRNQLNGVSDGFKNLMGDIISAATGAVASLPALLIQRANPGLYELLSNGILQARIDFDRSKLKCEELAKQLADYATSSEWGEMAGAQYFQSMLASSNSIDAVTAVKDYEENKGENGVAWIGGARAGGKNQPPIRVTEDVVKAGYNALHSRSDGAASPVSDCRGGALCTIWSRPQDAADWAVRVLGESERQTCNDGCEPIQTVAGVGLIPLVQEEFEEKYRALEDLLAERVPANPANLAKASSGMLPVTRNVIELLKQDEDQEVLARRLASEAALSSVMEKGMLLLRTLQAGSRNPNVEGAKPAAEGVAQNISTLHDEIALLRLEMDVRNALSNNTARLVVDRGAAGATLSKASKNDERDPLRVERLGSEVDGAAP